MYRRDFNRGLPLLTSESYGKLDAYLQKRATKEDSKEDTEEDTDEVEAELEKEAAFDPNLCPDCWAPLVRVASYKEIPAEFAKVGSGFYRQGHSIWELRSDDYSDGGYILVRKHEERAVDLRKNAQAQITIHVDSSGMQDEGLMSHEELLPACCPTCGHSMSCDCRGFETCGDGHMGEGAIHEQGEDALMAQEMHASPDMDTSKARPAVIEVVRQAQLGPRSVNG